MNPHMFERKGDPMSGEQMTVTTYPVEETLLGGDEIKVQLDTIPEFVRDDLAASTLASVEEFLRQPGGREFIEARKAKKAASKAAK